jgi:hypothetical protein
LFDAITAQFMRELKSNVAQDETRVISFSSDDRFLAIAGGSKTISIIDVATGSELRALRTSTREQNASAELTAFVNSIDPKTLADFRARGIRSPEQIVAAVEALGAVANEKFPVGNAVSMSLEGRYLISRRLLLKTVLTEIWDTRTWYSRANSGERVHARAREATVQSRWTLSGCT